MVDERKSICPEPQPTSPGSDDIVQGQCEARDSRHMGAQPSAGAAQTPEKATQPLDAAARNGTPGESATEQSAVGARARGSRRRSGTGAAHKRARQRKAAEQADTAAEQAGEEHTGAPAEQAEMPGGLTPERALIEMLVARVDAQEMQIVAQQEQIASLNAVVAGLVSSDGLRQRLNKQRVDAQVGGAGVIDFKELPVRRKERSDKGEKRVPYGPRHPEQAERRALMREKGIYAAGKEDRAEQVPKADEYDLRELDISSADDKFQCLAHHIEQLQAWRGHMERHEEVVEELLGMDKCGEFFVQDPEDSDSDADLLSPAVEELRSVYHKLRSMIGEDKWKSNKFRYCEKWGCEHG